MRPHTRRGRDSHVRISRYPQSCHIDWRSPGSDRWPDAGRDSRVGSPAEPRRRAQDSRVLGFRVARLRAREVRLDDAIRGRRRQKAIADRTATVGRGRLTAAIGTGHFASWWAKTEVSLLRQPVDMTTGFPDAGARPHGRGYRPSGLTSPSPVQDDAVEQRVSAEAGPNGPDMTDDA